MNKKDEFKNFVRKNPSLIKYVNNNEMTWQKFYEIYDLYGEDNNAWNEYIGKKEVVESTKSIGFNDMLGWIKNIDLDSFQNNINSIQRVVSVLQELGTTNNTQETTYKPRPIYKHFED